MIQPRSFYKLVRFFSVPFIICVFAASLLLCETGFRNAVEVGPDDHFEVTKAFLVCRGYGLYKPIWNDQPPFYTVVLAVAFKLFGTNIVVARGISLGFSVLLLSVVFVLVQEAEGHLAAWIAMVALLSADSIFGLCLSSMIEVPAIAIALLALWPIRQWHSTQRTQWVIVSGFILALAFQTKFTSIVALPALVIEILLPMRASLLQQTLYGRIQAGLWWLFSFVFGICLLSVAFRTDYRMIIQTHFALMPSASAEINRHILMFAPFLHSFELLFGTLVAIPLEIFLRRGRRIVFPCVMLATALLIHSDHRPYWYYYHLHFAVPLAWLAATAVSSLLALLRKGTSNGKAVLAFGFLGFGLIAIPIFAHAIERIPNELERIRRIPRITDSIVLSKMQEYSAKTRWVYTPDTIFAFHSRLLVIPELAVVPMKRFWSGQITGGQIFETVRHYFPEQVLVEVGQIDLNLLRFLQSNYRIAYEDRERTLFVLKSIALPDGK